MAAESLAFIFDFLFDFYYIILGDFWLCGEDFALAWQFLAACWIGVWDRVAVQLVGLSYWQYDYATWADFQLRQRLVCLPSGALYYILWILILSQY